MAQQAGGQRRQHQPQSPNTVPVSDTSPPMVRTGLTAGKSTAAGLAATGIEQARKRGACNATALDPLRQRPENKIAEGTGE